MNEIPANSGRTITNCTITPSLPTGLTFGASDCSISGSPTDTVNQSNVSSTVTAINSGGNFQTNISITIYRMLFVTSTQVQGDGVLDSVCQGDGNKPAIGTYKAVVSNDTTSPKIGLPRRRAYSTPHCGTGLSENFNWVLAPSTDYRRADGLKIMTTNSAGIFVFGTLSNAIIPNPTNIWTGLSGAWREEVSYTCHLWTDRTNSYSGAYGTANVTGYQSIYYSNGGCIQSFSLLCAQQ